MKLKTTLTAMLLATSTALSSAAQPFQTGMSELTLHDADGDRHIKGFFWYPTAETDGAIDAHGNAVWEPIQVIPYAPHIDGKKPLVLLSHGSFGNARNQAWLAKALTAKGYLVAAIDHPGTSTFQRNPEHRRELWERPRDISRTLDHLLAQPGTQIDQGRIFMAGHSLGGMTAVSLAGGRIDPAKIDADCGARPEAQVCGILDAWNVGKTPQDKAALAGDLSDPRIKGFALFDLGGTQMFSPDSLAAIDRGMFVIGAPLDINGLDLDVESRALADALPSHKVHYAEPAGLAHFDFLGVCSDRALAILKKEKPDDSFVCEDGTDARRKEHDQIAQDVAAFFARL